MSDKNFIIEVIGLIVLIALTTIEYFRPGNEISFWLLLAIAVFVVIYVIYAYVKQKIEAIGEIRQRVDTLEQKLNFKNDIHDMDKRLSLLEKNVKR